MRKEDDESEGRNMCTRRGKGGASRGVIREKDGSRQQRGLQDCRERGEPFLGRAACRERERKEDTGEERVDEGRRGRREAVRCIEDRGSSAVPKRWWKEERGVSLEGRPERREGAGRLERRQVGTTTTAAAEQVDERRRDEEAAGEGAVVSALPHRGRGRGGRSDAPDGQADGDLDEALGRLEAA